MARLVYINDKATVHTVVSLVYETSDGKLYVGNESGAVTQVDFCPFTGYRAKTKLEKPSKLATICDPYA